MIVVISCNKYLVSGGERAKNTLRVVSQGCSDLCFVQQNVFWTFSLFHRLIILKNTNKHIIFHIYGKYMYMYIYIFLKKKKKVINLVSNEK